MPLVYRSMKSDSEDESRPMLGDSASCLGVRVPPSKNCDIIPDELNCVHPKSGGMSVAPHWTDLKYFRIPKRLKDKYPGASGNNSLKCWKMGEGDFESAKLTAGLYLRPDEGDSPKHGVVEPDSSMSLQTNQKRIADTQDHWSVDEEI